MERALTATGMPFSDWDCKATPVPSPGTCEEEMRLSFCPCRASPATPISQGERSQESRRVPPAIPAQLSPAEPGLAVLVELDNFQELQMLLMIINCSGSSKYPVSGCLRVLQEAAPTAPRVWALQRIRSPSGELQRELSPREQLEDEAGFGTQGKEKPLAILAQPGLAVPAQGGCGGSIPWDGRDPPVPCAESETPAPWERLRNVTVNGQAQKGAAALLLLGRHPSIPLHRMCGSTTSSNHCKASLGTTELLGG